MRMVWALLLVGFAWAGASHAQPDESISPQVRALFEKMENGQRTTIVRGVVRLEETRSDSLRRFELREVMRRPDDILWDHLRMPPPPAPPEQYEREKDGRPGLWGGRHHGPREPLLFDPGMWKRLGKNFSIAVEPGDPVLGRPTILLRLDSRDSHGPDIRFWVDDSTGILLRRTFARSNRWRRTEEFKHLIVNPNASQLEEPLFQKRERRQDPSHSFQEFDNLTVFIREAPFEPWLPKELPAAYDFVIARIHSGRMGTVIQLSYTDGATAFSIFESVGDAPRRVHSEMLDRPIREGETVELVRGEDRVLVRRRNGRNLTVLGSAPRDILLQVLDQLPPAQ